MNKEEQEAKSTEGIEKINQDSDEKIHVDSSNGLTKNKKIIMGVIGAVMVLVIIIFIFLLTNKGAQKEKTSNSNTTSSDNKEEINYQEVMEQYGTKVDGLIASYLEQNGKIPSLENMLAYVKVGDYEISCKEKEVSPTGKVYLGECTINDLEDKFFYGNKEAGKVTGSTIYIYKKNVHGFDYYNLFTSTNEAEGELVSTFSCKTDQCEGIMAYHNYLLVSEDGKKYLYNYNNNELVFGPLEAESFYALECDTELYGIYYEMNHKNYLYSISVNQTFTDIGILEATPFGYSYYMYSKGYAPFENGEKTDFVNLKTGKVVFTIPNVYSYERDEKTGNVYILEEEKDNNYRVYDSKGNILFNGEAFHLFFANNDTFVVVKDNVFRVYNAKYQLIYTSEAYTEIKDIGQDYLVVLDGTNLKLVDYRGTLLTTFITDWSDDKYYYHSALSGWYTENGKNGIYLVIEGGAVSKEEILKNHPDMIISELDYYDLGNEYYYIPSTKETGKIATYIGGYAKPVLYIYPVLPTMVTVSFKNPNNLTTTYPKYKDKWTVLANSNGDLYDLSGKYYYALYWEEKENHRVDFKEGFYVTKENAIPFLEEKLTTIGLNDKEKNEFIMYWLPILEKNDKSLVYFELTEERDYYSPIHVSPSPDSILRLAIHVKKVDTYTEIKEQKLVPFERKGFTIVEWGGVYY